MRRTLADHHAASAPREAKLATLVPELDEQAPAELPLCRCSLGQLERMRPEYAEMLRHVELDEEPLAGVAASLGTTVNKATVRLHRAREALRTQLEALCGTDSVRACVDCSCD